MSKSWQKIIIMVGGAIGLLGSFLPWISVSMFGMSETASAFDFKGPWGVLVIIGALAALGTGIADFIVSKKITRMIASIAAMVGGALMAGSVFLAMNESAVSLVISVAGMGIGMILSILGGVVSIVGGILCIIDKKHDKDGAAMPYGGGQQTPYNNGGQMPNGPMM